MSPSPTADASSRGTSVIVNALQVIRCFSAEEPLQGVTEIAARVGLHKSSVSRILATLEQEHVVERDEATRKYRLGLGLIAVAGPLLADLDVRRVAMDDLRELAERSGETSALSIWDADEAVTVEQIPSSRRVKHTSALGSRYSTGLNATVQVFLSAEDPERVRELIESGRVQLDGALSADDYLQRLRRVRRDGCALNLGETDPDEVGIAAPLRDHRGAVVGVVLLAAPAFRVPAQRVPELAAGCRAAAARISRRLGSPGSAARPDRERTDPLERAGTGTFRHALHDGVGGLQIQHHFAGELSLPVAVQTWTLEPGAGEGGHAHPDPALEELYFVLEGSATMTVNGREHHLGSGDAVLCRPQDEHGLLNTGPGPLRVQVIWGPPGEADFTGYATYRRALRARAEQGGAAGI